MSDARFQLVTPITIPWRQNKAATTLAKQGDEELSTDVMVYGPGSLSLVAVRLRLGNREIVVPATNVAAAYYDEPKPEPAEPKPEPKPASERSRRKR